MPLRRSWFLAAALAVSLALAAPALAHVERTSYWPDPAPDTSVTPPAGGDVPKARSLSSALSSGQTTRVVCKPNSPALARPDITKARLKGYKLRPTQPAIKISKAQARKLV